MASTKGAHGVTQNKDVHAQIANAIAAHKDLAANHTAGLADHETVAGDASHGVGGFDSVIGPGHDTVAFAGKPHGVDKVLATQSVEKHGVTVHFDDGSSITVAGISNLHNGFFHH
jgi:hypothetical protein